MCVRADDVRRVPVDAIPAPTAAAAAAARAASSSSALRSGALGPALRAAGLLLLLLLLLWRLRRRLWRAFDVESTATATAAAPARGIEARRAAGATGWYVTTGRGSGP